mmetsp:Transcript_36093/g.97734  ORF Transcript_36093/g.97734 Transcript_36093/m.97734 type:complete len:223 (-) Transcript_36093:220-888(-)
MAKSQWSSWQACVICRARPSKPREATLCATFGGARLPIRPDKIMLASVTTRSLSASSSVKTRRSAQLSASANHCLKPSNSGDAVESPVAVTGALAPALPTRKLTPDPVPCSRMSCSVVRESAVISISSALRCCSRSDHASLPGSHAASTKSMGALSSEISAISWQGTSLGFDVQSPASSCLAGASGAASCGAGGRSEASSAVYMAWAIEAACRYSSLVKYRA